MNRGGGVGNINSLKMNKSRKKLFEACLFLKENLEIW